MNRTRADISTPAGREIVAPATELFAAARVVARRRTKDGTAMYDAPDRNRATPDGSRPLGRFTLARLAIVATLFAAAVGRLDVGDWWLGHATDDALLTRVDAPGPAGPTPAATELLARLCDGRLAGEEAARVVRSLWTAQLTPGGCVDPGAALCLNARLDPPPLAATRDDGPALAWRLIDVRIDDACAVRVDGAAVFTARLGSATPLARSDEFVIPARCRASPGPVRLTCRYAFELRDAAGGTTRWEASLATAVRVLDPDAAPAPAWAAAR